MEGIKLVRKYNFDTYTNEFEKENKLYDAVYWQRTNIEEAWVTSPI